MDNYNDLNWNNRYRSSSAHSTRGQYREYENNITRSKRDQGKNPFNEWSGSPNVRNLSRAQRRKKNFWSNRRNFTKRPRQVESHAPTDDCSVVIKNSDQSLPHKVKDETNEKITDNENFIPLSCNSEYRNPPPLSTSPFYKYKFLDHVLRTKASSESDQVLEVVKGSHDSACNVPIFSVSEKISDVFCSNNLECKSLEIGQCDLDLSVEQASSNNGCGSEGSSDLFGKSNFTTFVESLVDEAKRNDSGCQTLKNVLWSLLEEKFAEFSGVSRIAAMEDRLASLESLQKSVFLCGKSDKSDSNIGGDEGDSSSDESIQCLEEFSTKYCTNQLPFTFKREKADETEMNKKGKRKGNSSADCTNKRATSVTRVKEEPMSPNSSECTEESGTRSGNFETMRDEKPVISTEESFIRFEFDPDEFVKVYTCGIMSEDGTHSGLGVWFADDHPLNVSFPIPNAMSEKLLGLQAVWIAVKIARKAGILRLRLYTFSSYVIKCIKLLKEWKERNWKKNSGKFIRNKSDIKKLYRALSSLYVDWRKVSSHCYIHGADKARQLASAALFITA